MIGYLRGKILAQDSELGVDDVLTIDVNGVGYELMCSTNTIGDLTLEPAVAGGAPVQVWVQTQLREDSLTLYGFSTPLEKRMFNSLLKVNGVGPKMAIKILSGATMNQLAAMIESGDVKALSNLPKVGKKTAEQLILSLKGKLVLLNETNDGKAAGGKGKKAAGPQANAKFTGVKAEILSALVNLGFRMQEVEPVVESLPEEIPVEQGIRKGLQALSGSF
jgi:holliday junction DNA helicase RuvA